jgi:hypothetical protein
LSFRVEEVDKQALECDPAAVDSKKLPVESAKRDRVNVVGEEAASLAKDLLDSNTAGSLGVWEKFN